MKDWYQVTVITSDLNCLSQGYKAESEADAQEKAQNNWSDIAAVWIEPRYVAETRRIF